MNIKGNILVLTNNLRSILNFRNIISLLGYHHTIVPSYHLVFCDFHNGKKNH